MIIFNFRGLELCIWTLFLRVSFLWENQGQHLKWPAIQRDIPILGQKLLAICLKDSAAIDRLELVSECESLRPFFSLWLIEAYHKPVPRSGPQNGLDKQTI